MITVVMPCAGEGTRLALPYPKEIFSIEKHKSLIDYTFDLFADYGRNDVQFVITMTEDKTDIKKAIATLNRLGKYNYSQGVVVRNKKIVAIEGKGGTHQMLKMCKSKKFRNKGVLVKFPKKKQDLRIDLPTIGFKTLTQCKYAGLKGIVLKSKQNVFLERKKCISFANKNKMFITVK